MLSCYALSGIPDMLAAAAMEDPLSERERECLLLGVGRQDHRRGGGDPRRLVEHREQLHRPRHPEIRRQQPRHGHGDGDQERHHMSTRWNAGRQAPRRGRSAATRSARSRSAIDPHHTGDHGRRRAPLPLDRRRHQRRRPSRCCFVGPPGEKRRLVPCFDSDYPGQSALTGSLAAQIGEWAADRARRLDDPVLVVGRRPSPLPRVLRRAGLGGRAGRRSAPEPRASHFRSMPIAARPGWWCSSAPRSRSANDTLADTHARCFALFAAVTRLKPADGRQACRRSPSASSNA